MGWGWESKNITNRLIYFIFFLNLQGASAPKFHLDTLLYYRTLVCPCLLSAGVGGLQCLWGALSDWYCLTKGKKLAPFTQFLRIWWQSSQDILLQKCYKGDRGESALFFFPTHRERAVYKLEGCTIHTWKICALGIFHAICRNLGLYMNAGEAKIKNRADSPQSEAMERVRI